jgi:hypothetical protein
LPGRRLRDINTDRAAIKKGGSNMKRVVCFFIGFMSLVLMTGTYALAIDTVQFRIDMYKDVTSIDETYGIQFSVYGDTLRDAARIFVDGPKGRRIQLNNTLDLNEIFMIARHLPYEDFNRWFPEGVYKLWAVPPAYGRMNADMRHNFPASPEILFPPDGGGDISSSPVILWNTVTNASSLRLTLKNGTDFLLTLDLPVSANSYTVPPGLLKGGVLYELSLEAKATDFDGNGLITTRYSSFTTKAN